MDDVPLQKDLLVSVVTDPELTQSSVNVIRKRPREDEHTAGDYRRDLVQRLFEAMLNERFDELTRRPDAKFLGAGIYGGNLSPKVETVALGANVQSGGIPDGLSAIGIEARRARQFGFGTTELDRAKKRMVRNTNARTASATRPRAVVRPGISGQLPGGRTEPRHRLRVSAGPAGAARDFRG